MVYALSKKNKYKKKDILSIDKQIEFCAMMRSGHHAIIYWIMNQVKEPYYYHNDILCHGDKRSERDRGKLFNSVDSKAVKNLPYYIYNIEDASLNNYIKIKKKYKKTFEVNGKNGLVYPKNSSTITIIRDPFNLFASRIKFCDNNNLNPNKKTNGTSDITWFKQDAIDRWKEYAKLYLGKNLPIKSNLNINYNQWFLSKKYRLNLTKKLQINFTDTGKDFVPQNGGGSSFDFRSVKIGSNLDVLNRWEILRDDERFLKILKDKELLSLSLKIWPNLTKKVLNRRAGC